MANFKETITNTLEPIAAKAAEPLGLMVHRIIVRGSEQTPVIELIIDGEKPVTLEDCAKVSREVNEVLEEGKILKGNFRLDVMSPGVDDPLTQEYQYRRNIGRLLKVQTKEEHRDKTFLGRLVEMNNGEITLELNAKGNKPGQKRERETVSIDHIKTAVVQVEFNPRSDEEENL